MTTSSSRFERRPRSRLGAPPCLALLATLPLAACDWLVGPGEPEEVTVAITSDDVNSARLLTSQHFLLIDDPECAGEPDCQQRVHIQTADTATVALPFERSYPLNERLQFHSSIHPAEEVVATLTVTVKIDGRDWYDDSRELGVWAQAGERETLTFTYQYLVSGLPGS